MTCNGSGEILSSADWADTQQETSRLCPGCADCENPTPEPRKPASEALEGSLTERE